MRLLVISHADHYKKENALYAYSPLVREMDLWFSFVDEVEIVAPLKEGKTTDIHLAYQRSDSEFTEVREINFQTAGRVLKSVIFLPGILLTLFRAMRRADHIHLRCPGNLALLGCLVQIFFPSKPKTAKYAGNWDPEAIQPWSYRLQKWILSNTFLSRNMKIIVYGQWPKMTRNVKPFFTATYAESERVETALRTPEQNHVNLVFAGTLSPGKRPLYAAAIVLELHRQGIRATIDFYGDGVLRSDLERFVADHDMSSFVKIHGNVSSNIIKEQLQKSHFLILPSRSEGWPKAVAEGMFWGCVPLATDVSCVSYMLDQGKRGVLLSLNAKSDAAVIAGLITDSDRYLDRAAQAMSWSREFTTDKFASEIKKLLET